MKFTHDSLSGDLFHWNSEYGRPLEWWIVVARRTRESRHGLRKKQSGLKKLENTGRREIGRPKEQQRSRSLSSEELRALSTLAGSEETGKCCKGLDYSDGAW